MIRNYFYRIIIIILAIYPCATNSKRENSNRSFQINENLKEKRCQLQFCLHTKAANCSVVNCMEMLLNTEKFGECPDSPSSRLDAMCIDTCEGLDYKCPGIQKCCRHKCGRTCQEPIKLDSVPDHILPPTPTNITLMSLEDYRSGRRTAEISWQMEWQSKTNLTTIYIIEARAHSGYMFAEEKLSNWFNVNIDITSEIKSYPAPGKIKTKFGANVRLRPGRWYQFRSAAINENGIRGYSDISHSFQLKERPRNPLPPRNFTIEIMPKTLNNKTVYTKASWKNPRSDYPIEKYKISWSLYLESNNGSLWLNDAYVTEPTRHFEFWDLKPNSLYYLQLQALSSFGRKRLKSPKEALFINTTIPANIVFTNRQLRNNGNIPNVSIRFVASKKYGLVVRVLWNDSVAASILEICTGYPDCFGKYNSKEFKTIKSKRNQFDFLDLKYETRYSIRLKASTMERTELLKTFQTPSCENFRRKHPHLDIICTLYKTI